MLGKCRAARAARSCVRAEERPWDSVPADLTSAPPRPLCGARARPPGGALAHRSLLALGIANARASPDFRDECLHISVYKLQVR